ncbi:MAG TPA: DUF4386 family protein [Thermoanaerobaculia bacterium]|jgi:hypothetical protein|nr:DUF4386 family protein [Thermoanaerobaculia bacterium]
MSTQESRRAGSEAGGTIFAGGMALIGGALAFLGVFSYLAARFQYPEVLDGKAQDVLPALLATGATGRAAWALYGVLPLVFIPAGVSAFEALRERAAGPMRVGALFAFLAAVCMVLGLMRWPSVHWELASAWGAAGGGERLVLAAVFDGLNRYLGNFVGEFMGELGFSVFFVLSGIGLLRHRRAPGWLGGWGIATGVLGLIGMWRNVTPAVSVVAEANNYLLPAWMIGFGVWLVLASRGAERGDVSLA